MRRQGISKVIRIYPLRAFNVCAKFHDNSSNNSRDVSVAVEREANKTFPSLEHLYSIKQRHRAEKFQIKTESSHFDSNTVTRRWFDMMNELFNNSKCCLRVVVTGGCAWQTYSMRRNSTSKFGSDTAEFCWSSVENLKVVRKLK